MSGVCLTSPQQVAGSFRLLHFQRNSDKPLSMLAMQISHFLATDVQIDLISRIFPTIKIPSFNLTSVSFLSNTQIPYHVCS